MAVTITESDQIASGSCPQQMVITRTWVAGDDCGNTSSCVQIITVQDTTKPVITCPENVTIDYTENTLPDSTGMATATDNCGSPVVSYTDSIPAIECPVDNLIYRQWTATDDCGNSSTCLQTILIEDHGSICGSVEDDLGMALENIVIHLYVDVNGSGTFDGGDTLDSSTSTDALGAYCFTDVRPCEYVLVEMQPATYGNLSDYDESPDPDGDDSSDGPDGEIPVVLIQGEADSDNNFIDIVCPLVLPVIQPDTICDGGGVTFVTTPMNPGPLDYMWDFGSGSTPMTATGLGPHNVTYDTTSTNQLNGAIITLTVSKAGCPDLSGQVSSVVVNAYPNPAITGSTTNLCYYTNRTFQPTAPIIPGATYQWTFGLNAVPMTATGYGPHIVYYTVAGPKTVKLVIHPNEAGAQCPDSSMITFNVISCPSNITGSVKSISGAGIQGVNLKLFADSNEDGIADNSTAIKNVFSTASGAYSMVGIAPGSYVIFQIQPSLWYSINDEDTSPDGDAVMNIDSLDNLIPATVGPSEVDAHNIFTEAPIPGSISGAVFIDNDSDQAPDIGEGMGGVVISLFADANKDGIADNSTPLDTAISSSSGTYAFPVVDVGNYVLVESHPTGYETVMDIDPSNDQDSVANSNQINDTIPVTVVNLEHDQDNYFIEEYECTLLVINTNNAGPGTFRFMVDCAEEGDTIRFDNTLQGQTIQISSTRLELVKDLVVESTLIPRITISSTIPGLIDVGAGADVQFRDLDIISGITGHTAAAFSNFGLLRLHNINVLRNPALPMGQFLILNNPGGEIKITGICNLNDD